MLTHETTDKGNATILRFSGSLDALSVPEVRPAVDQLIARGGIKVVVDMSAVATIDSSGVALIISLFKRLGAQKGVVRVAGVVGQPKEIFYFLRLEQALALFPSVDDALKGL
jgi:anti-sigma B factor antagonist